MHFLKNENWNGATNYNCSWKLGIIKCQWPSISGQEWIFTLPGPPPPPQMNEIYKTMVILKTLSIRQWRTVIPGRQEANRVSPLAFQAHCLERVSRPWCGEDKHRQGPVNSLSCGDRDGSLAGVHRTVCLRESHREKCRGSTEGLPHIFSKGHVNNVACL